MTDTDRPHSEMAPAPPGGASTASIILTARSLAKRFGATQALRDATLELLPGEVHALVGENGSGKSTFVKILSGVHAPDAGVIELDSVERASFGNPRTAQRSGVVTIFQEVLVAENMSVLDNLWAGTDGLFVSNVPRAVKRARAQECLGALMLNPPRLDASMGDLPLSERQACAIARGLLRDPRVLILDEATSALDYDTRTRFFGMISELSGRGVAIVLITHRMDEIEEIADRVTVMRSGSTVASLVRGEWDQAELVRLMTGAESLVQNSASEAIASAEPGAPILRTEELTLVPGRRPIDMALRRGEIVGLAGLEGHGQDAFLRALCGGPAAGGAVIRVDGETRHPISSLRSAADAKIAYVPRERGTESGFSWMSILENFALPTVSRDSVGGWYRAASSERRLAPYVEQLRIKIGRDSDAITTLSGGNQQKVMIARWLAAAPDVLLLNDPTRGIDVNAKRDLYRVFASLAQAGTTVIMLSTELDEHIELMDRVLVFREQELSRVLTRAELSREALVSAFFGTENGEVVADVDGE